MSVRETLNQKKALSLCVAIGFIVIAIGYLFASSASEDEGGGNAQAWYTTDDGKTWFAGDASSLPPFEKDGKTAYGCIVWTSDGGKTKQVSHLYRYSEETRKRMRDFAQKSSGQSPLTLLAMEPMEVKKPGTGNVGWVKATDPRGIEIQSSISAGGIGTPEAVLPE